MAEPAPDANLIEQARRRINTLAEEIAKLSDSELEPQHYYGEYLQRVLTAIAAPAGAIWLRTPQGNLQLQYQINMREVGLDKTEAGRQGHDELLRQAVMRGQPGMLPPRSGMGPQEGNAASAGNPTDFVTLLAPILVEKQVAGLVEVWQDPGRGADAQRGFLQFLVRMAGLASAYTRNYQLRQMTGQQQVWTQLETFARQVHGSLNPTEVAYVVANEGRRLLECDRVSVAVRLAGKAQVEAISGADVVEKRSNLVRLMRDLFNEVMAWGERLVYRGVKDDALPPKVLHALDAYLAESNSKLLVVMPLRDDRETDEKRPPRAAVMMESFEPAQSPEQLMARLEVVCRHATPALYNSAEHKRIPGRWIWMPLARIQEGLGGKAKAIIYGVTLALAALITAMVIVPYPLKMDAKGQILPKSRAWIYSPQPGVVVDFAPGLRPGSPVALNQEVVVMYSLELGNKIRDLRTAADTAKDQADQYYRLLNQPTATEQDKQLYQRELSQYLATHSAKLQELEELRTRTNAVLSNPGEFRLKSPI
jgi:hypothetical protein